MPGKLMGVVLALFLSAVPAMAAEWRPIGPYGGHALKIVLDSQEPTRLYVATKNGQLYRTLDGGELWEPIQLPAYGDVTIHALAIDPVKPATLYVGTAKGFLGSGGQDTPGILVTHDRGHSWSVIEPTLGWSVLSLAIHPHDPRLIVVGTLEGVFMTSDGGQSFRRMSPPRHSEIKNIVSVAIDTLDPQIVYAGTPHLPWRTTDGGASWTSIHRGMIDDSDVFSICVDRTAPARVYASACSGIYLSRTRGTQWAKMQGIPGSNRRTHLILQDPVDPAILYAGTTQGLWKSNDGGTAWLKPNPFPYAVNGIAIDPTNHLRLYLATDRSGILKSEDGGKSFRAINQGFVNRNLTALWAEGPLYASSAYDGDFGGIFLSRDHGNSWILEANESSLKGKNVIALAVSPVDPQILFAGTYEGLLRSVDGGRKWLPIGGGVPPAPSSRTFADNNKTGEPAPEPGRLPEVKIQHLVFSRGSQSILYAATDKGLFFTEDHGTSWRSVSSLPGGLSIYRVALHPTRIRQILLLTSSGIFHSENSGQSWEHAELDPHLRILDVAINPGKPRLWAGTSRGLYRSDDNGRSWSPHHTGLPLAPIDQILVSEGDGELYAHASRGNQLYLSSDEGESWQRLERPGLEGIPIQRLYRRRSGEQELFAVTQNRGIYWLDPSLCVAAGQPRHPGKRSKD
ncbi:MAG: hypothetical protein AB1898_07400 [Acidobacteriota bacterium]